MDIQRIHKQTFGPIMNFASLHHGTYSSIDPLKADLSGKSVAITGSSKGLGLAAAISFARAGCSKIAVSARSDLTAAVDGIYDAADAAGRSRPLVVSMRVDVAVVQDVQNFADMVDREFGGVLDVLINNAGISEKWTPILELSPEDWWNTWEINMKGVYLNTRFFLPLILKSSLRTIINVSSIGAHATLPGASSYQGGKLAVARLTEAMAVEHYDDGLVAISLHPGGVKTDIAVAMHEEFQKNLIDTPELSANFTVWLCKEKRAWLSGRWLMANWDVDELLKMQEEIEGRFDMLKFRMVM